MTAGPCESLAKIELISHDGAHGAYLRGVSEPVPCTHSTATSPTNSTTSSAVRGEASVDNTDTGRYFIGEASELLAALSLDPPPNLM